MAILFINACVRKNSRTLVLAKHILSEMSGEVIEVNLNREHIAPLNRELLEKRERLLNDENKNDPMFYYATQFTSTGSLWSRNCP